MQLNEELLMKENARLRKENAKILSLLESVELKLRAQESEVKSLKKRLSRIAISVREVGEMS